MSPTNSKEQAKREESSSHAVCYFKCIYTEKQIISSVFVILTRYLSYLVISNTSLTDNNLPPGNNRCVYLWNNDKAVRFVFSKHTRLSPIHFGSGLCKRTHQLTRGQCIWFARPFAARQHSTGNLFFQIRIAF